MSLHEKKCVPCEGGTPPLTAEQEQGYLKEVDWELDTSGIHKIKKHFTFSNFKEAMGFVNRVAEIAETQQHHPDIYISYSNVFIELYTHAVTGLSENDFIMASKISHTAQ